MTYMIQGLDPAPFAPLFGADEEQLARARGCRLAARNDDGYPCRVSLEDARRGEALLLVHHVSNDVPGPFRIAHAIYVREGAGRARPVHGKIPAMLDRRTLSVRGFARDGALAGALLAPPGEADAAIRALFARGEVAYIHAHNAAWGCFLAGVERAA